MNGLRNRIGREEILVTALKNLRIIASLRFRSINCNALAEDSHWTVLTTMRLNRLKNGR